MNAPITALAEPAEFLDAGPRTILTPRHQAAFLDSLAQFGNVRLAARAGGVSPQTAYRARRRSRGFALAWDAALLAARSAAEEVLADRALHGVEEAVFYHGEEVARRRRYDSRLLLAHLARLDRLEAREEVSATLAVLEERIEGLRRGEALPEEAPRAAAPGEGWEEDEGEGGEAPEDTWEDFDEDEWDERAGYSARDRVPCVPPCRDGARQSNIAAAPACPDCGGRCDTPGADLSPEDCQWLGNRLSRMDAARPAGAREPWQLGDAGLVESLQLEAFEAGLGAWWLIATEEELDARLAGEDAVVEGVCREVSAAGPGNSQVLEKGV